MKQEFIHRTISGTVGDIAFTGIFDADLCEGREHGYNPKMHDRYEINVIAGGEYLFEDVKNRTVGPLRKGDVVFVSPGYYHEAIKMNQTSSSKYRVRFEIAQVRNSENDERLYHLLMRELQILGNGIFVFRIPNSLRNFDEIYECFGCCKPGSLAIAEASFKVFMTEFFMEILHLHSERKQRLQPLVDLDSPASRKEVIEAFLEENYSNSKLTADMLAKHLNLSVRQMNRIVSSLYQMTFYQLLTSVRLSNAKKMLLGGTMPIKDVAINVGYDSSTGFFVAFKKKYGVTPGEFSVREKSL